MIPIAGWRVRPAGRGQTQSRVMSWPLLDSTGWARGDSAAARRLAAAQVRIRLLRVAYDRVVAASKARTASRLAPAYITNMPSFFRFPPSPRGWRATLACHEREYNQSPDEDSGARSRRAWRSQRRPKLKLVKYAPSPFKRSFLPQGSRLNQGYPQDDGGDGRQAAANLAVG